jgi:hypothetical protein
MSVGKTSPTLWKPMGVCQGTTAYRLERGRSEIIEVQDWDGRSQESGSALRDFREATYCELFGLRH